MRSKRVVDVLPGGATLNVGNLVFRVYGDGIEILVEVDDDAVGGTGGCVRVVAAAADGEVVVVCGGPFDGGLDVGECVRVDDDGLYVLIEI